MAGIGFELKKMFNKKGLFAKIKAYGYAGIVCIGPMILGILLLLGIRVISGWGGASSFEQEYLNGMITYTLLFSLVITNFFNLVTTRFTADQLFMEREEAVMPSFWGGVSIMLVIGDILFGIFLFFSGVSFLYGVLLFVLFGELITVWTEMNYITAIKDYKGILVTFVIALLSSWILGIVLAIIGVEIVAAMLLSVVFAYAMMALIYYKLLISYFPKGNTSSMLFLAWFDKYPQLAWLGGALAFGLFGHLVIMWLSPLQVPIKGLFVGAPMYDIPALMAFLSILVTTINFVTSVEVNFYSKYRNYYSLFNDGGSLMDIRQAEKEMKSVLIRELANTFTKQFFATIVFIIVGTIVLPYLPLGMNEDMLGIYRILCLGYAFYTIGNCCMLMQLYFADNKGALISGLVFMVTSCGFTILFMNSNMKLYGVGFLIGGISFTVVSLFLLIRFLDKIMYHVLCSQPVVAEEKGGFFTDLSIKCEEKYRKRYHLIDWGDEEETDEV